MNTWTLLSSSSITDDSVKNAAGDDLGDIKDLMIDTESGTVVYAVLSFGGFLGLGDKLFAIPFQALEVDRENEVLRLNISKERLENAPGFDKDNWPSTANRDFVDEVYEYYGYEPFYAGTAV